MSDYRSAGQDLSEIRSATAKQQAEIKKALPSTPGGVGLRAALELLDYLAEHFEALDERQRVQLVSGEGIRVKSCADALEIRERVAAMWLRSEDKEGFGLKVSLLIAQGGLPSSSRTLLRAVQKFVEKELVRLKLPRMRLVEWSHDVVTRKAREQGLELDIDEEAARVANQALKGYREAMQESDPLVYGAMTAEEARLWLACGRWVVKGKMPGFTSLVNKRMDSREDMQRLVVRTFDQCRRFNVSGPSELQRRMDERLGRFNGNRNHMQVDTQGVMRYGDGVAAERDGDGQWKRPSIGYGEVFEDRDLGEILREIERVEYLESK